MKKRKLGIIGGSGLYNIEGFLKPRWVKVKTTWGEPSDRILTAKFAGNEVCFLPRHARGHKINPSNINFRANIDALKQLGVTDIISVSAVGSLKEDLNPGTFVIVDQFIDRTFARVKTFFDSDIVAHVSMAKPTSNSLMECCQESLKKLNINKISLFTPYSKKLNDEVLDYFKTEGFEITSNSYFDIEADYDIGKVDQDYLYEVLFGINHHLV